MKAVKQVVANLEQAKQEAQLQQSVEKKDIEKPTEKPEGSAAPAPPPQNPVSTAPITGPKVIRNGDIEFEVDSFDSAVMRITKIVAEESGFVSTTESDKLPNGKVKGRVVLRCPPERLDTLFARDVASNARRTWRVTGPRSAELELDLGTSALVGVTRLQEDITKGQSVAKYTIFGSTDNAWRELARGTTIGYTKLDRVAPTTIRRVKVVIEDAVATPEPVALKVFAAE